MLGRNGGHNQFLRLGVLRELIHFKKIADNVNVSLALEELDGHPFLWNDNPERLKFDSPHRETDDIWLRYRSKAELHEPSDYRVPHFAEWYLGWRMMPAFKPIVFGLANFVQATNIGGVFITRIKPGGTVYWHSDKGFWHSEFHNTKVWLPLRANEMCLNHCDDETVRMHVGECWTFDNLKMHAVENKGETERITLIMSFRTEP